jgi:hypothetical protein
MEIKMDKTYFVYPNYRGCVRGQEDNRGVLRNGVVENNQDMQARAIGGLPAYVTQEAKGQVRFYVFLYTDKDAEFPNVPLYCGPYTANSEDII